MTRLEGPAAWFGAVESRNYARISELVATYQGSRDAYGDTALMLAARNGDTKSIQIILPYEAGLANVDNQTALIVAALCDQAKACRFLVAAEKDCLLADGRDALMLAAQVGNVQAVDALVDHFPPIRDNNGTSALDYASGEGFLQCVELITKRQDLSFDDIEYAINIAMARKHYDIVSYLNSFLHTFSQRGANPLSPRASGSASAPVHRSESPGRTHISEVERLQNALRDKDREIAGLYRSLQQTGSASVLQGRSPSRTSTRTLSVTPAAETAFPQAIPVERSQRVDTLIEEDHPQIIPISEGTTGSRLGSQTFQTRIRELEALLNTRELEVARLKRVVAELEAEHKVDQNLASDHAALLRAKDAEILRLQEQLQELGPLRERQLQLQADIEMRDEEIRKLKLECTSCKEDEAPIHPPSLDEASTIQFSSYANQGDSTAADLAESLPPRTPGDFVQILKGEFEELVRKVELLGAMEGEVANLHEEVRSSAAREEDMRSCAEELRLRLDEASSASAKLIGEQYTELTYLRAQLDVVSAELKALEADRALLRATIETLTVELEETRKTQEAGEKLIRSTQPELLDAYVRACDNAREDHSSAREEATRRYEQVQELVGAVHREVENELQSSVRTLNETLGTPEQSINITISELMSVRVRQVPVPRDIPIPIRPTEGNTDGVTVQEEAPESSLQASIAPLYAQPENPPHSPPEPQANSTMLDSLICSGFLLPPPSRVPRPAGSALAKKSVRASELVEDESDGSVSPADKDMRRPTNQRDTSLQTTRITLSEVVPSPLQMLAEVMHVPPLRIQHSIPAEQEQVSTPQALAGGLGLPQIQRSVPTSFISFAAEQPDLSTIQSVREVILKTTHRILEQAPPSVQAEASLLLESLHAVRLPTAEPRKTSFGSTVEAIDDSLCPPVTELSISHLQEELASAKSIMAQLQAEPHEALPVESNYHPPVESHSVPNVPSDTEVERYRTQLAELRDQNEGLRGQIVELEAAAATAAEELRGAQEAAAAELARYREMSREHEAVQVLLNQRNDELLIERRQVADLEADRDALSLAFDELNEKYKQLTERTIVSDQKTADLAALMQTQTQAFRSELSEKEAVNSMMEHRLQCQALELDELKSRLARLGDEFAGKERALSEKRAEAEELQLELAQAQAQAAELTTIKENLKDISAQLERVSEERDRLAEATRSVNRELTEVQGALVAREAIAATLTTEQQSLSERITELEEERASLRRQMLEAELQTRSAGAEAENYRKLAEEQATRLTRAISDLDTVTADFRKSQTEFLIVEQRATLTNERFEAQAIELRTVQQKCAMQTEQIEELRREKGRLESEITRLSATTTSGLVSDSIQELSRLTQENERKTASLEQMKAEMDEIIRTKDEEIAVLKGKIKKYKTAYVDTKAAYTDVTRELGHEGGGTENTIVGRLEHSLDIARKEIAMLQAHKQDLQATIAGMRAQEASVEELQGRAKKYKDGYVRKTRQLEETEAERDRLKMQNRYLSAKIGMSESQVAGEDGEDNGGSLDHRLVLAEEARAALANELEVLKQAFETEVCGLQAELESEKLRSQMAGKAYQDAIIALSENTTETMVEISKYEEIQRALEEQRARAQESDTRARDLALKNDELSGNYTILMNELAATREQLEEKAVDAHQKGLEIEKLQEIIAGDRGNTGETRELFEAVSRSVYVTDDDRAALVAGVNESIQLSMAARSMCINASSFEGASMRSLQLNTSLPPAGDNAGTNTSMQVGLMTDVGLAPSFLRSQSTSLCNSTDPDALQSSFCGRRVRPRQTTLLRNVGMEASMQCTTPEQSADGSVRSNLVQSHTVRAAIGEAEGERVQQLASICIGPSFVEHDGAQASLVYNNSKYYDEEMFNLARTRIIELESELDALKARLAEGEALTQGMRTTLELVDGQAGPDGEARMDAFIVLMRENSRIKGENESLLACVESLQAENARLKKELADACAERGSLRVLLDQQSNPRPISTASIHSTALLEMRRSLHGRDSVSLSNSHTVPEPPASPGVSRLSMSGAKRRFVDFMPYIDTNTALSVTMVDRDVLDGEALRNTELMRAVIRGDVMGVSAYLGQAKMRNANGRTALMLAAEVNNVDAAFKLAELEGGIATPDGETALRIALEHYNIEIASLLVAWEGIDMRGIVATNYTKTELMGAAERADLVSAFCLMRTQAGLQDRRGRTAMMYAAERGHYRIVRLLVRAEAGLQDVSGESALMIAARHGHIKVCRLLAAREAGLVGSPDPLLAKNQTALMLACFYGHLEVVRLLYAAERDIQSQNGKTAYQYARYPSSTVPYETQQQIVAYLEEAAAATY